MDRNEVLHTVGRNATAATQLSQAALADVAERLAPYIDQASERIAPLAADAVTRIRPALREAQIRGARAAAQTLDRVQPTLDDALDKVTPFAAATVKRVGPVIEDALTRIPPGVDVARGVIQEELLPKLSESLTAIARQPLAEELALPRAASHELAVVAKPKKSFGKRLGLFLLVGAIVGGVALAIKKALEPPDTGWVTHTPDDAYIADPVADAQEPVEDFLDDEPGVGALPDEEPADEEPAEDDSQESSGEDAPDGGDASPFGASPYGPGSYVGDEPPQGYTVKGNTRSMKFHLPGQAMYARTTAEVWFDSAESAQAAGFSPVRR